MKDLLAAFSTQLKPLGFKKRHAVFTRENAEVLQAIQIQRSVSSTSSYVKLTLNFGVHSKAVDRIRGAVRAPSLGHGGMHFFTRINQLLPDPRIDFWMEVYDEETAKAAISEFTRITRDYLIPLLETMMTSESLLKMWTEQRGLKPDFDRDEIISALSKALEEKE